MSLRRWALLAAAFLFPSLSGSAAVVKAPLAPALPAFAAPAAPAILPAASLAPAHPQAIASAAPAPRAALAEVRAILRRGGAIAPEDKKVLDAWFPSFFDRGLIGREPTGEERIILEAVFPKLSSWRVTGSPNKAYNCISWSVGLTRRWTSPSELGPNADRFYRVAGLVAAPVKGRADVALWADSDGALTHASRHVWGPWWESKIGESARILHRLDDLENHVYGRVVKFYRALRRRG